MGDVRANFLQPIARQFPLPKGASDSIQEWERDYVEALSSYTDSLLGLAAKRIIKHRELRSFPLVAECVRACRETLEEMSEPDLRKPIRRSDEGWSPESRARADRLFKCEMGREAVKDGWAWSLWDFLRENGRHPTAKEVEIIRSKGMANTKQFWQMMQNPPKVINPLFAVDTKEYIKWHQYRNDKLKKLVEAM
jgi:hypothetical protein